MYDVLLPKILSTVQGVELKRFAMTPGIDFLNHSSLVSGKAEVTYDYFSEKFIVESGEEYKTGEEVFISYGAQSNDSFLQYYGFVEEDNAAETFKFGEDIAKMLGVNEGKLILRRSGFDKSTLLSVSKKLGGKEKAGLITLQKLCDAEVTNMATTVEQDTDLLKERKTKENPRLELAIQYRREKKKLLETIRSPR